MNARSLAIGRGVVLISTAAVVVCLAATPARADLTTWNNGTNDFGFDLMHVPDFDQRRHEGDGPDGFPNDGNKFCVPTSSVNLMCYLANHGWPDVAPGLPGGPHDWNQPAMYGPSTFVITLMASVMGTDPWSGTGGDETMHGLEFWLRQHPFVIKSYWPTSKWSPTFETAMEHAMDGAYVLVAVGWYNEPSGTMNRNGGHMFTLTHGERDGADRSIGFRDPWTTDSMLSQSNFSTEFHNIQNQTKNPSYGSARTMSQVQGYQNGWIDWVIAIKPTYLIAYLPGPGQIIMQFATQPDGWYLPTTRSYDIGPTSLPKTLLRRPNADLLYLTETVDETPGEIWRLDTRTHAVEELSLPVSWPLEMVEGRMGHLYVRDGHELVRLDLDDTDPPMDEIRVETPDFTTMDFDDSTDQLVMFFQEERVLRFIPADLDLYDPETWDLDQVPLEGQTRFCWNDEDDSAWFVAEGAPGVLLRLAIDDGLELTEVPVPGLVSLPDVIQSGDEGRMYVFTEGRIVELEQEDEQWGLAENRWFAETTVESPGPILFARSRSTWDGQSGEEWRNELPVTTEPTRRVLDCDSDVDGDGIVDVDDLIAVILSWSAAGHSGWIPEDVNQSGFVDVDDLLMVILGWGPCP